MKCVTDSTCQSSSEDLFAGFPSASGWLDLETGEADFESGRGCGTFVGFAVILISIDGRVSVPVFRRGARGQGRWSRASSVPLAGLDNMPGVSGEGHVGLRA